MANIGDRVLARWPAEKDWFYPGVVCAIEGGKCDVQFDDGGRDQVDAQEVLPLHIGTGARVHGNWKAGGAYYPGRVALATGQALAIKYDDGDEETTSVSLVRVHRDDLN